MTALPVLPSRPRLADLLYVTDHFADEVLAGRHDHRIGDRPPVGGHRAVRLHGDDELDVWLISWAPRRSAPLHDHGESLGAVTVVSGALRETRWDGNGLRRRSLVAGDQAGFPQGWVHDIGSAQDERDGAPTLSVHAYSPPMGAGSHCAGAEPAGGPER